MDATYGQRIYACVHPRHSLSSNRRNSTNFLSTVFDLFSGLSREVSIQSFNCASFSLCFRMLMACLKYLAGCPCPRCLILKSHIPLIGTKTDTKRRVQLARVDSVDRQRKIELARRMMFEGGVNITSTRIDDLLSPASLVPTRVCFHLSNSVNSSTNSIRTHSQSDYSNKDSISMKCSYQIFFMNLNWVSGRLYLHIYSEFFMHAETTKFRP